MKFLLDYLPILIFVGIYFISGAEKPIYPAVQGLMVASLIQTIGYRLYSGHFEKMHVWTLIITLVFGGMTLFFKNAAFIQWKASIVVWAIAAAFLFRQFVQKKLLLKEMLSAALEDMTEAPGALWQKLNLIWPVAYLLFGLLNLYVAYNFSEAFWVNFKLFGLLGLNFILLVYTMVKIFPYFPEESEAVPAESQAEPDPHANKKSKED